MVRAFILLAFAAAGLWSLVDYALFAWKMRQFGLALITLGLLLTAILGVVLCK